ncbi:unnamed protein product [Bursaphelenchus xylophilus]|uniref:Transmembrane protein 98 n=1 Tax=Bursaphelenchus xylophilus TaxID=6326 RepID=A0A1I7SC20_BURXY|nr:unnamed protein product [Bursaphelenchus xylophilus]CAG9086417.1 unnamed protein product [Bursaphelenchus xylophilus]
MDVVVYLALAVLCAVFIISLVLLVVMCRRRYEYNRLLTAHSLRFSKLKRENMDDFVELSPYLSQALSNNEWVFDVNGVLEHSVCILKLCHVITDKLSSVSLEEVSPQLNELICEATARVVPRFDAVLQALAARKVDVRLTEARVTALTTAVWALIQPFCILDPKYKETFGPMLNEMDEHQRFLAYTIQRAEEVIVQETDETKTPSTSIAVENRKPATPNGKVATATSLEPTSAANETLLKAEPPDENGPTPPRLDETTPPADPSTS